MHMCVCVYPSIPVSVSILKKGGKNAHKLGDLKTFRNFIHVKIIICPCNTIIRCNWGSEGEYLRMQKDSRLLHNHTWYTVLHFIALHRCSVFYTLRVCDNPELSKSVCTSFCNSVCSLMSLGHSSVILAIFQTFATLWYLLLWSAINELWWHYCDFFWSNQNHAL